MKVYQLKYTIKYNKGEESLPKESH